MIRQQKDYSQQLTSTALQRNQSAATLSAHLQRVEVPIQLQHRRSGGPAGGKQICSSLWGVLCICSDGNCICASGHKVGTQLPHSLWRLHCAGSCNFTNQDHLVPGNGLLHSASGIWSVPWVQGSDASYITGYRTSLVRHS